MKPPVHNALAASTPPTKAPVAPAKSSASMRPPQLDGNQTTAPAKPTRGPLQDRPASPASYATSGIERSMGDLADQMHPRKKR